LLIGITNDVIRRAAEQLRSKGIVISAVNGLDNLSRADARAVEQVLIEEYGGPKGPLLNKINSISPKNPLYSAAIKRGCELLALAGVPAPSVC
jgi:filamentous hemagglutinin